MSDRGERTEQPTPKRLERARKEGRFATSREINGAAQFLAFALIAAGCGSGWIAAFSRTFRGLLRDAFRMPVTPASLASAVQQIAFRDLAPLVLAGTCVAGAGVATHLASTRLGFSFANIAPKPARLNPASRLPELARQNIPQLVHALLLLPVFVAAAWTVIAGNLDTIRMLPLEPASEGARRVGDMLVSLLFKAAAAFVIAGAIDFYRQKRRWMADMKMTKQEVREEAKEGEVSPQVKGRIRRLQREFSRRRMMQEVPAATAIVVNPTHFSVAIRYTVESMPAPVVVAKGRNALALRIRRLGAEHNVPIVENPPLARALYKYCAVGQEIPAHLYRAVAEILAYLFRLAGQRGRQ